MLSLCIVSCMQGLLNWNFLKHSISQKKNFDVEDYSSDNHANYTKALGSKLLIKTFCIVF